MGEEPGEVAGEVGRLDTVASVGRLRPRSSVDVEGLPLSQDAAATARLMTTRTRKALTHQQPAGAVVESVSYTVPKDSPVTAP